MKEQMTEDTRAFLKEREDRFGGKIVWRGFSLFYGDSQGNLRTNGVLVFQIGSRFYYEDFEVVPKFLGLSLGKKSQNSTYEKFEGSFKAIDVSDINYVRRSDAEKYVNGAISKIRSVSPIGKLFCEVVMSLEFEDGSMKFFEIAGSQFRQLLDLEKNKYKWSKTVYDKENGK